MFWKAFCLMTLLFSGSAALAERASNPKEIVRFGTILHKSGERGFFHFLIDYKGEFYRCAADAMYIECSKLDERYKRGQ